MAKAIQSVFTIFYSVIIFSVIDIDASIPVSAFNGKVSGIPEINRFLLSLSVLIIMLYVFLKGLKSLGQKDEVYNGILSRKRGKKRC